MKHIPNLLCVARIALIPVFLWQLYLGNTGTAAVLLAVSGVTDLLDGFLARRFGWVSQLGKVLDPVADKLTQVSVCVALFILMHRYWPVFAILLFKDFVMLVLGGYLLLKGVKLEGAKFWGKVSTTLFYVSMTVILLFDSLPDWVINVLLGLTIVSALASAFLYIPEFIRYRNSVKK